MFDTMKIASVIKQARIEKNMTQMNLADAMGVSYQAVSNWERGNSMPDISKLEDLCRVLEITVDQLLGMQPQTAAAVNKVIREEELTVEELKEVAPVLPPEEVKKRVESERSGFLSGIMDLVEDAAGVLEDAAGVLEDQFSSQQAENGGKTATFRKTEKGRKKKLDLSSIAELAPFLDQDYLDELIGDADLSDLDGLEELAPFLSEQTLEKIVERADLDEMDEIAEIAPFLSETALNTLVDRCLKAGQLEELGQIAPFLPQDHLDELIGDADLSDLDGLEELVPFLSEKALEKIVERASLDQMDEIAEVAAFLSETALNTLVDRCLEAGQLEELEEIAAFLSRETLDRLVDGAIAKQMDPDELEGLYPFLSKASLRKLAKYLLERRDLDALEELVPFV